MSLWLHLGCGPNKLPAPWENHDRDVDIARPLPFDDGSARFIFAEHVIEHVPFVDGMAFLSECRRVLEPGGVLRLSFPDVTRFTHQSAVDDYCRRWPRCKDRAGVFRYIMLGSGHRACWTADVAHAAALAVGFRLSHSQLLYYGASHHPELAAIDGHHKTSPVAELETTVIEATK